MKKQGNETNKAKIKTTTVLETIHSSFLLRAPSSHYNIHITVVLFLAALRRPGSSLGVCVQDRHLR